ncbi:Mss4 protein-domain-containing protein [Mortierella sp. GBAus27b]|nr:hypothetical protein BGX31_008288 [Mortierella sp. GBA43]KAI8361139.1 Mss4 protein-domain-containing protein [Mortierella sp. GBAus27b]
MTSTRNPGKPYEEFEEKDLINTTNPDATVNNGDIYCPQENCRCKILLAGAATLVQRPKSKLSLPNLPGAAVSSIEDSEAAETTTTASGAAGDDSGTDAGAEELQSFWRVGDMMAFENVGFSRRLANHVQFLICADCDTGPLGYHVAVDATKEYLIALNRVRYTIS